MVVQIPPDSTADEPPPLFLFIPLGLLINIGGVFLNSLLNLPLFLDSAGTILAGVILGPWLGAATGFLSNLIIGLVETPISIPFGIVNAAIGLIAGVLSRRWGFRDVRTALALVLILTAVCPILATPIVVYLFGGVSGSAIDKHWAVLVQSGHQVFSSAFLVRLPANLADKIVSVGLVWGLIRLFPPRWRGQATSGFRKTPPAPGAEPPPNPEAAL